jgi:hypothetical protein
LERGWGEVKIMNVELRKLLIKLKTSNYYFPLPWRGVGVRLK